MKKKPLVSFCIATYKRPEFVKSTLNAIKQQKSNNYEVVIVEDSSENTAENVIKSFRSNKIIYHKNKRNLGMTKSYNKAISLADGRFITVLADDDPPTPNMLETFIKTLNKYPTAKAFFGGSYVHITTSRIEKVTHLTQGFHSLVNKNKPYGSTEILESKIFFKKFLTQEIFPHYQWTATIISKDILKEINGVPDYNSAHFIDYAYILKIAAKTNFVMINQELAAFALHELSYGKKQDPLDEYKRGVIGFDKSVAKLADKFNCREEYHQFLSNYIIMFLVNRLEHYKRHNYKIDPFYLFNVYSELCNTLPFLKKRRLEVFIKLTIYYRFILIYHTINFLRHTYGRMKMSVAKV